MPLGAAWALAPAFFLGFLGVSCVRGIRQLKRGQTTEVSSSTQQSPEPVPNRVGFITIRRFLGITVRLVLVVITTLTVPNLVWLERQHRLTQLATEYSSPDRTATPAITWGACSSVFLGYELTQHGAEGVADAKARETIHDRVLADAQAELDSIKRAGARLVRAGASGDQLLESNPDQERLDDLLHLSRPPNRDGIGARGHATSEGAPKP